MKTAQSIKRGQFIFEEDLLLEGDEQFVSIEGDDSATE